MGNEHTIKIVAVVIVYYPDIADAILNIKRYIDYVDKLIIWQNTPFTDEGEYNVYMPDYEGKIIRYGTGKNEGIAYPINRSIKWAIENKCTHIITMDQDSYWINFQDYLKFIQDNYCGNEILTPNINELDKQSESILRKATFIISGTVIPISTILKIGNYNEDLFVDCVDIDYSLRARLNNIGILSNTKCVLKQRFGEHTKCEKYAVYSAQRTYNIVKNHVTIIRKYWCIIPIKQKVGYALQYVIKRIYRVLLFENNKREKLCAIIRGCYKGMTTPLGTIYGKSSIYFNS